MIPRTLVGRRLAPALGVLAAAGLSCLLAVRVPAQGAETGRPISRPGGPPPASPPGLPAGVTVQDMWPAPTEADWSKPVQIRFERTWEDALAVQEETRKPILICINMDGEPASEHYAGIKYRDPAIGESFDDYVCVIASVYRHTPRDHDASGRRILCPRFGSVTCGEHIAIEPVLYEKYMDGQRISPRHIMVELDATETYDVFYAWDNASIFDTIRDAPAQRDVEPRVVVRGDRPILERVASRAQEDRLAVEKAWREGDRQQREALLQAALANPEAAQVGLLRLAIAGFDAELASLARRALAKVDDPSAVGAMAEALAGPASEAEREALVAALERLADRSPQARMLANVHRGLGDSSGRVDPDRWVRAMQGGATYAPPGVEAVESKIAAAEDAVAKAATGDAEDPAAVAAARLDLAESFLTLALDPEGTGASPATNQRTRARYVRLMLEDARRTAEQARDAGASGWRVAAVEAVAADALGDADEAKRLAVEAMEDMPAEPTSWVAVRTLGIFGRARIDAIWEKLRAKQRWPREWTKDVDSAFGILARHPLGTAGHARIHYDFLDSLGARRRAGRVLEDALKRFPTSAALHERFRNRVLERQGVEALEPAYTRMAEAMPPSPDLQWFAAFASIVAADFHRRAGEPDLAAQAYDRALSRLEDLLGKLRTPPEPGFVDAAAAPAYLDSTRAVLARALAGKARIALDRDEYGTALELAIQAMRRCPEATDDPDGLSISLAMTVGLLREQLQDAGRDEDVARLDAVLDEVEALDPALLILPDPAMEVRPGDRARFRERRRRR